MENIYRDRIAALRRLMAGYGWDAVVVGASDPHKSEYPAPRWQAVRWLTGFTGEAGSVVVTASHAGLWTDSRYFIQAAEQLEGSGVVLHKTGLPDSTGIPQWLAQQEGVRTVGLDGSCMSVSEVQEIEDAVGAIGAVVADVPDFFDDGLWTDRPCVPVSPVITLDREAVGQSRLEKLSWLRESVAALGCDGILLSALDEIAWVLNVRGSDIEYNPYVISYLYVSRERTCWFVLKDGSGLEADSLDSFEELAADGVEMFRYDDLPLLSALCRGDDARVLVDLQTLNYNLYSVFCSEVGQENVVTGVSPVPLRKAVKNSVEIVALHEACIEDGVALEKFLFWLEQTVASGRQVSEWDASVKLTEFRGEIVGYRGNSFENISAYGPNAALPHYSTPSEGSALLQPKGLYLTDSGGQYFFGTTDITRTVPLGELSELEREDYTLVLRGMIRLAMAVFPRGTAGCQLDVLARDALWRRRRNFGHGTGHGIGFYLGVHEGPQSIRQNFNAQPLVPGMVTSDEPGIYRAGMHGVRHENMVLCVDLGQNEFGQWLGFETLTVCHFETGAIIRELLGEEEVAWLNEYNESVFRRLSPRLPEDVRMWLRGKTAAV